MRIDDQLKLLCLKSGCSLAELARRIDKTPQAFNQKMKRGHFSIEDLEDISIVMGCELRCEFVCPDGETIKLV